MIYILLFLLFVSVVVNVFQFKMEYKLYKRNAIESVDLIMTLFTVIVGLMIFALIVGVELIRA